MTTIARPCLTCGRPTSRTRCPACDHTTRTSRQPWRAGYTDPTYIANRELALARDSWRCVRCGATGQPLEADHIVELRHGGTHDLTNLRSLCRPCHHDRTAGRWA